MKALTLRVEVINHDRYLLVWDLKADPSGETYTIERGEAPNGTFETLGTALDGDRSFADTYPPSQQKYIPYYYRIRYEDNSTSPLAQLPYERNKFLLQHVRMTERYLRRDVGERSMYFHRILYGERCPVCWDATLDKSVTEDCQECLGTGYYGGYSDGTELYVAFPPDSPRRMRVGHKVFDILQPSAWTSNYPLIFPGDVILRLVDKELFRVGDEVRRLGRRLHPGRQMFPLTAIERRAVEYKLIDRVAA